MAFIEIKYTGVDPPLPSAPETFLIDQKGVIRYKHIGPINRKIWKDLLWPMIEKLQTKKGS